MPTYQDALSKPASQALNAATNPIGNAQQNGGLQLLQAILQLSPIAQGARMLGSLMGTEHGQNPLPNMAQNEAQAVQGAAKQALSPFQEGVAKGLRKLGESQATEAAMAGVPPEHITQQAGLNQQPMAPMMPQMGPMQSPAPQTPMSAGIPQQQPQSNILQQILGFLATPSGVNQDGSYRPGTSFGGLIQESNDSVLAGQQALNLQPDRQIAMKQREANEVPLSLADKQKMEMQGQIDTKKEYEKMRQGFLSEEHKQALKFNYDSQLEQLKTQLKGDDQGASLQIFQNDMTNLIQAWDQVPIKAGLGGVGGLAGKGLAALNLGSEQVANFESQAQAFLFSAASAIARQEGREVTEKDIARVQKIAGFSLTDSEERFNGKLQAVLNLIKNRGAEGLPKSARDLRSLAKGKLSAQSKPSKPQSAGKYKIISVE